MNTFLPSVSLEKSVCFQEINAIFINTMFEYLKNVNFLQRNTKVFQ